MTDFKRMDRREAIKWMVAAAASASVLKPGRSASMPVARGYGTDPNLMDVYKPDDFWPLTFTPEQRRTVVALCDVILPRDERSPSASELHVQDFIDEWVSAPYPQHQQDRKQIVEGLAWLEGESKKRFQKSFADLGDSEKTQICDDISYAPKAARGFESAAGFFARFRDLTTTGFYTTPEGMKDIHYVGNVALTKWDGPPPEVLSHLGLS
jgi:hypothetical protein